MVYTILAILVLLTTISLITLAQSKFGKLPSGERLERIKRSPNYRDGAFQNQSRTPVMVEGVSYFSLFKKMLFKKSKDITPLDSIPSIKTDLKNLDPHKDVLVWFGHSSYFIQLDGKRILVDPVLSTHASPFSFSIKAFKGSNPYTVEDIPEIDYLFITHDHWDHLDYATLKKLKPKIKTVICGLGVGADFEYWGFNKNAIVELDWNEQATLADGFVAHATPARHFSGRAFKRNQTLWVSFVLQTPSMKLFFSGDGGYDTHFSEIGKRFGPIDLAILENGQYDNNWRYIHLLPDENLQAFRDLQAKQLLSTHSAKFALGNHPWYEPLAGISAKSKQQNVPLITPCIGEQVNLKDSTQKFTEWWMGLKSNM